MNPSCLLVVPLQYPFRACRPQQILRACSKTNCLTGTQLMRRRPAALILAVLVALTTLALKQQHASLPTLGLADQAAVEDILSAIAPTSQLVIVLITAEGREDVIRSGRPWRKVRLGPQCATYTHTATSDRLTSGCAAGSANLHLQQQQQHHPSSRSS